MPLFYVNLVVDFIPLFYDFCRKDASQIQPPQCLAESLIGWAPLTHTQTRV